MSDIPGDAGIVADPAGARHDYRRQLGYHRRMVHTDIIDNLKRREAELRALGVDALYLFGSHARGDARPGSDVDLFFDAAGRKNFSLLDLAGIADRIGDLLCTKADVHLRDCLHRRIRPQAETDALRVF